VCNFTPNDNLSHGEVVTLFHEMGHVLQHICSDINDINLAGISGVEWDAVEWSSQFFELMAYEKDILQKFINPEIPDDIIEKINLDNNYRQGVQLMRQVELSLFDMLVHKSPDENVQLLLDTIRATLGNTVAPYDKFQCGFSHIFAGGYSAGYYSYKWAEVLSIDCFEKWKSVGLLDKENAKAYYNKFLTRGSSELSSDMFKSYMGREPKGECLINYYLK
jgi:oligopeptidase A